VNYAAGYKHNAMHTWKNPKSISQNGELPEYLSNQQEREVGGDGSAWA
jgi:hypothetical protein